MTQQQAYKFYKDNGGSLDEVEAAITLSVAVHQDGSVYFSDDPIQKKYLGITNKK